MKVAEHIAETSLRNEAEQSYQSHSHVVHAVRHIPLGRFLRRLHTIDELASNLGQILRPGSCKKYHMAFNRLLLGV